MAHTKVRRFLHSATERWKLERNVFVSASKPGHRPFAVAKRLKVLEAENARLKKLLAEAMLENEVTREALRKKY
jgi:hypothetical protein